jgi:hypothetical protein
MNPEKINPSRTRIESDPLEMLKQLPAGHRSRIHLVNAVQYHNVANFFKRFSSNLRSSNFNIVRLSSR